MTNETPSQYLARIGSKGGQAAGSRKRRGTPADYAELARKSHKARQAAAEAKLQAAIDRVERNAAELRRLKAAEAEAELRAAARAKLPRTFGDLKIGAGRGRYYSDGRCSFCKAWKPHVARYSVRHSVCEECAEARRDVVLPRVKAREAFEARMQAAGRQVRS